MRIRRVVTLASLALLVGCGGPPQRRTPAWFQAVNLAPSVAKLSVSVDGVTVPNLAATGVATLATGQSGALVELNPGTHEFRGYVAGGRQVFATTLTTEQGERYSLQLGEPTVGAPTLLALRAASVPAAGEADLRLVNELTGGVSLDLVYVDAGLVEHSLFTAVPPGTATHVGTNNVYFKTALVPGAVTVIARRAGTATEVGRRALTLAGGATRVVAFTGSAAAPTVVDWSGI